MLQCNIFLDGNVRCTYKEPSRVSGKAPRLDQGKDTLYVKQLPRYQSVRRSSVRVFYCGDRLVDQRSASHRGRNDGLCKEVLRKKPRAFREADQREEDRRSHSAPVGLRQIRV